MGGRRSSGASGERATWLLGECYWPGVTEDRLAAALVRADSAAGELGRRGRRVELHGSILVPRDETVLCLFGGSEADARAAAEHAGLTFERMVESRWYEPPPTREIPDR